MFQNTGDTLSLVFAIILYNLTVFDLLHNFVHIDQLVSTLVTKPCRANSTSFQNPPICNPHNVIGHLITTSVM